MLRFYTEGFLSYVGTGSVCRTRDGFYGQKVVEVEEENNDPPLDLPSLFTRVLLDGLHADVALDLAAPVEFAVATLLHDDLARVVAPAAAHDRAVVQPRRVLAAHAAVRARPLELLVVAAPIGTLVQVDQVHGRRYFIP